MAWDPARRELPALRHWHPVAFAHELSDKPLAVSVHGYELVVFRTEQGLAALEDRCSHRGARLSPGAIKGGCIECPYHLWTFDRQGQGQSPVNPKMKPFVSTFEVKEHAGAVWVRRPGSDTSLPEFNPQGMAFVGYEHSVINAPLRIVIDNFTEIEHSPTNHFVFAFDREGIKQVEPQIETDARGIHVTYAGPQRASPWWTFAGIMGARAGLHHVIDFRVGFSPMSWCYDMYWEDPRTKTRLPQRVREYAMLTPKDDGHTDVFLWFYTSVKVLAVPNPIRPLARTAFMKIAHHELMLDKGICENVAGCDPRGELKGLQLGKFDRVLWETRRYLGEIYEAAPATPAAVAHSPTSVEPAMA